MSRAKVLERIESVGSNVGSHDSIGEGSFLSQGTKTIGSKSSSVLPDFASVHESYNKALARGRHPKSIPRKSELWHYTKLSNERVSRISKGHKFWNVIDDTSVAENSVFEHDGQDSKAKSHGLERHSAHLVTVNGIQFDTKSEVDIHYGMSFVITNYADEILCVDINDKVKCKARALVEPTDRIMFKLFDMNDATNPGVVHYGDAMWMQLWKADATEEEDFVIGSKLFESPSMNAMSLAQDKLQQQFSHIGSDENKSSIFDMTSHAGSIAELENATRINKLLARTQLRSDKQRDAGSGQISQAQSRRNSTDIRTAGKFGRRRSSATGKPSKEIIVDLQQVKEEGDEEAAGEGSKVGAKAAGSTAHDKVAAAKAAGGHKATDKNKKPLIKRQTSTADDYSEGSEDDEEHMSMAEREKAKLDGKKKGKRRAHADVCGGVEIVRITDTKKARMALGYYDNETVARAEKAARYHSKESWHLGQWCPRTALRNPPPSDVLKTRTAVYLEQDLYCLASSQGYMQGRWPKMSADFVRLDAYADESQLQNSQVSSGTLSGLPAPLPLLKQQSSRRFLTRQSTKKMLLSGDNDDETEVPDAAKSLKDKLAALGSNDGTNDGRVGTATTKASGSEAAEGAKTSRLPDNVNGVFGCLRKIAIRGPPYEHVIDRRCVWTFCVVEDQSNLASLNAQDLIAAKIMTKARRALQRSEMNRKGAKTFSQEATADGRPLLGGETFTRTLRTIVGEQTFQKESDTLSNRRKREERIKLHFEEVLYGKDFMLLERDAEHRRRALEEANFSTLFMNRSMQTSPYRYNNAPQTGSTDTSRKTVQTGRSPVGGTITPAPMLKSIPELASSTQLTSFQNAGTTFLTGSGFVASTDSISRDFCSEDTCGIYTLALRELSEIERRALARLSERKLDILVADDNPANRKTICQALQSEGHMCFEATDGLDVLTKTAMVRELGYVFDVIIMDVVMPNLDGPACAQRLRKSGYSGLIIGVAGTNHDTGIGLFKQHGADEVMPKPLTLHGFHEKLLAAASAREEALSQHTSSIHHHHSSSPRNDPMMASLNVFGANTGASTPVENTARSMDSEMSSSINNNNNSRMFTGGANGRSSTDRHSSSGIGRMDSSAEHLASLRLSSSLPLNSSIQKQLAPRPKGIELLNKIIPLKATEELEEEEKKHGSGRVLPPEAPFKECLSFGDRVLSVHQSLHHLSVKVSEKVNTQTEEVVHRRTAKKDEKKKVDLPSGPPVGGGGHLILQTLMEHRLGKVKFDTSGRVEGARGPPLSPRLSERGGGVQLKTMGALRRDRAGSMDFDVTRIKVSNKLTRLQEEDKLIKEALEHKEKLDKYKHVSDLFDTLNDDLPAFC